ncbi:MAG: leucine--tRNA ligase [Bdellovibrionales bacterium]|nr:leucine--tRNA ligase [Bdellovibrionales bacterium]
MAYPHKKIDKKWQDKWEEAKCFQSDIDLNRPKFYALDMFPYPSGHGLHVGHLASYTPTDIVARFKRLMGFNVLHPMGYDAFGLPAEQYAIQTGVHPALRTNETIEIFRRQLKTLGYSFDWNREISTCDPETYKGTQAIFLKLFEKGLAYQKVVPVNWCPALRTVLANEEVVNGVSERGGHPVVQKGMKQWMLKITAYAERLLNDLDKIDWPEATKAAQRNWIGKSEGARIQFSTESGKQFEVYTTRPDTLFGATFMVMAPEHPLVTLITTEEQRTSVETYKNQASKKSELDRKADTEKTGVFTGAYALNPINQTRIPIWISDYVLMEYGTGAIMAVPAHDSRDFEFAQKFDLPIVRVLESDTELPFDGDGKLVNSEFLDGLSKPQAISKMIQELENRGVGKKEVQYKLRDWLFSRQRYWGEPFPIVHMDDGTVKALSSDELPISLPEVADYNPSEDGEPPLARAKEWLQYADPKTGKTGQRETDTMPGSAGSSWYFLRYTDPKNSSGLFSFEAQKYWMPVDLYIGGAEHTVGHLLYARFWQKVLFDCGLVSHDEPFQKLAHQGVVMGPDGARMSKSRGNVINPDDVCDQYGADAARVYVTFIGPFDKDKPWDTHGIEGTRRFLDRIWRLCVDENGQTIADDTQLVPEELERLFHKTIKKVGEDYDSMSANTAISALMILVNEIYKYKIRPATLLKGILQMLNPVAPHVTEELWEKLGETSLLSLQPWPKFNPDLCVDNSVTMGVQVNGKMRGKVSISLEAEEDEAMRLAREVASVKTAIGEQNIVKVIYKPGKILNIIVK